uniref:Interleukin 17c n=1 Tax=Hippocampus comes TaxID=109280 RepID=A0A3Q2XWI3_HIPCM
MAWFGMQMVGVTVGQGRLPPRSRHTCINQQQLDRRADKFQKFFWNRLTISKNLLLLQGVQRPHSCAMMLQELHGDTNNRSLSPWTYRLYRDDRMFPHEIVVAECLCQGCIINQREEQNYNSVPVFAPLMVLRKDQCPSDPNKYILKKVLIKIPVACTCVVPKVIT